MAAGLGFKDFTTGEVLTAADVDGYLMQGVWVFASAAARDAAVTSPQEGNFAYLKDTNVTTYYTGSAWTNLDTTGMTNPMTTTGDTIYSSSGSTPARLGIGSTGQVLTVSGGVPTWAAPAGGGKVLQVVSSTYTTQQSVTGTTFTATGLSLSITPTLSTSKVLVLVQQPIYNTRNSADSTGCGLRLKRGSTIIDTPYSSSGVPYYSLFWYGSGSGGTRVISGILSMTYLDSPATTSSTTYSTEMANEDANGTTYAQFTSCMSTITLLEIGA